MAIELVVAGIDDPRRCWFLAASRRRRAGVRIVAECADDPAEVAAVLDQQQPSMLAVVGTGTRPMEAARAGLAAGVDVVIAPPLVTSIDDLESLAGASVTPGRLMVATTWQFHPAMATISELLPTIGDPLLVGLLLEGPWSAVDRLAAITELIDTVAALAPRQRCGPPVIELTAATADDDSPELSAEWGDLRARAVVGETAIEVRLRGSATAKALAYLWCSGGAIAWQPRTGMLHTSIGDRPLVTVPCTTPDEPELVLEALRRGRYDCGIGLAALRAALGVHGVITMSSPHHHPTITA